MNAITKRAHEDKGTFQVVECILLTERHPDGDVDPYQWASDYCHGCDMGVLRPVAAPQEAQAACTKCYPGVLGLANEQGADFEGYALAERPAWAEQHQKKIVSIFGRS